MEKWAALEKESWMMRTWGRQAHGLCVCVCVFRGQRGCGEMETEEDHMMLAGETDGAKVIKRQRARASYVRLSTTVTAARKETERHPEETRTV